MYHAKISRTIALLSLSTLTACSSYAPSQSVGTSTHQNISIKGAVGQLAAEIAVPPLAKGEKVPMVIIMHGFMLNKDAPVLTSLAQKLAAAHVATIRFDFNGHGKSEGAFQDMTVPKEVLDAQAVLDYVKGLDYVSSISLAGHSQGGVVTSLLAGQQNNAIRRVVLLAPAGVLEEQAKSGAIMGNTFDPKNPPEYIEVFGNKVGKAYLQTAQTLNIYANAAKYRGEACIIHGRTDEVVPYAYAEKYQHIYNNAKLYLIDDEDHMLSKQTNQVVDLAVNCLK